MAGKRGPDPARLRDYEEYLLTNPNASLRDWCEERGIPKRECGSAEYTKVRKKVAELLRKRDEARRAELERLMEQEAVEEAEDLLVILKGLRASMREAFTGDNPVFCDTHRDVLNAAGTYKTMREYLRGSDDATDSGPVLWEIDSDD